MLCVFFGVFILVNQVYGHAQLKSPPPRAGYGEATSAGDIHQFTLPVDDTKVKACAIDDTANNNAAAGVAAKWVEGEKAMVSWTVLADHDNAYQPGITVTVWYPDGTSVELFKDAAIDPSSKEITVPKVCDSCVLTWTWERGTDANGGYYTNCADITIVANDDIGFLSGSSDGSDSSDSISKSADVSESTGSSGTNSSADASESEAASGSKVDGSALADGSGSSAMKMSVTTLTLMILLAYLV